jgi:hypothetical protein
MPAARYARFWPEMDAFALPSFYDGRVRINLVGREAAGRVAPEAYDAACETVIDLVRECRDPVTGEPVLGGVERVPGDPLRLAPSEADLTFVWANAPTGFVHPRLGTIGPLPYRRTGGHTGGLGVAYIASGDIPAYDGGVRSAFDVVPTLFALLGEGMPPGLSGKSLLN